eukprot:scaffold1545_cov206-Amphora_coffeaeformis.AAC.1
MEYKTFRDMGRTTRIPPGYQQIPPQMVFDVKQTLKQKAQFLLRIRSIPEWQAYEASYTKQKVCTIAGPEFGPLQGHMLIIDKALYGLHTSGARFHAKFADTLRTLGFTPTYADPDVWIWDGGDCFEYIVVYVDDIFTVLKEPAIFYDAIQSEPWNYKLTNVEEPKYHLGGDFFRDSDGTFCYGAQTYVKRMSENYEQLFVNNWGSPVDSIPISFRRRACSHVFGPLSRGHLERLRRLIGYMKKRRGGAIRFRTGIPDWENAFPEPIKYD